MNKVSNNNVNLAYFELIVHEFANLDERIEHEREKICRVFTPVGPATLAEVVNVREVSC